MYFLLFQLKDRPFDDVDHLELYSSNTFDSYKVIFKDHSYLIIEGYKKTLDDGKTKQIHFGISLYKEVTETKDQIGLYFYGNDIHGDHYYKKVCCVRNMLDAYLYTNLPRNQLVEQLNEFIKKFNFELIRTRRELELNKLENK